MVRRGRKQVDRPPAALPFALPDVRSEDTSGFPDRTDDIWAQSSRAYEFSLTAHSESTAEQRKPADNTMSNILPPCGGDGP